MEETVKKRGWIKNAAIIFLAVMLVLTFFSNTIMNHSLPEAATQAVYSGTIDSKVRGTGTVTAAENYEVTMDQSRKVKSVLVKVGDEVQVGDVLFVLEEGGSEELEAAKETLRQLNMQYQRALIQATDSDYAKENRDISQAREALLEAQEKRDSLALPENTFTDANAAIDAAKADVSDCLTAVANCETDISVRQKAVNEQQKVVDAAQEKLNSLGGNISPDDSTLSSIYNQIQAKEAEVDKAGEQLETLFVLYGDNYNAVVDEATERIKQTDEYLNLQTDAAKKDYIDKKLSIYMAAVAEEWSQASQTGDTADQNTPIDKVKCAQAYERITACTAEISQLELECDSLWNQYYAIISQDNTGTYNKYKKELTAAQEELETVQGNLEEAQNNLEKAQDDLEKAQSVLTEKEGDLQTLQAKQADYEAAVDAAESCQRSLEDLIFALQEQQKSDEIAQKLENLDMQDMLAQIEKAQTEVNQLSGDGGEAEVKCNVNGIVKSLSVSAGHTAEANTALAVIEVPDLGYSLSFSVTSDQAKLVRIGDTASVYNYYWGSQIDAVLSSIQTDPQNPRTGKILTFNLSGDVTAGESLSLSVGQKSAEYDYVVPNSALRSDNNGSFVLVVTAKSSPLSTRYIASRVDVEVIASDDKNSAVTGALNAGDFVITTSNKPVSSGDQVRLPDSVS